MQTAPARYPLVPLLTLAVLAKVAAYNRVVQAALASPRCMSSGHGG